MLSKNVKEILREKNKIDMLIDNRKKDKARS